MNDNRTAPVAPGDFIDCGDGLWNARGSFKIAGILEAGTQASLVALPSGNFLWLDSITLEGDALAKAMKLTDGGKAVEAILNLHPFHTLHCEWANRHFPNAKLYGSARHKAKLPNLRWQEANVEDPRVAEVYAETLDFSLPRGVDYISPDENVHFSSLLAMHRPSATIHVDDTFGYRRIGRPLGWLIKETPIFFHPTLSKALQQRAGAAEDFRAWARELASRWKGAARMCAAHSGICDIPDRDFEARVTRALARVERVLAKHQAKFGA